MDDSLPLKALFSATTTSLSHCTLEWGVDLGDNGSVALLAYDLLGFWFGCSETAVPILADSSSVTARVTSGPVEMGLVWFLEQPRLIDFPHGSVEWATFLFYCVVEPLLHICSLCRSMTPVCHLHNVSYSSVLIIMRTPFAIHTWCTCMLSLSLLCPKRCSKKEIMDTLVMFYVEILHCLVLHIAECFPSVCAVLIFVSASTCLSNAFKWNAWSLCGHTSGGRLVEPARAW